MSAGFAFLAAVFVVNTVLNDGTKTSETVEAPEKDGVVSFTWPRAKVPANFRQVSITPDFALAKKDEEGYWVLPDNTYGTYRLDQGRHLQSWHVLMPMFGMKTPRATYCAIVKGMPYSLDVEVSAKDGVYSQRGERPWASRPFWPWLFGVLCVSAAVWSGLAQGEGPRLLFPTAAQCLACYALWTVRVRFARLLLVAVSLCWLAYDVLSGSIPGTVCEVFSQISLYIAIVRDFRRSGSDRRSAKAT